MLTQLAKILKLSVALLICFVSTVPALAVFYYEPVVLVVKAPNGRGTNSITITNPTLKKTVRVQLGLREWEVSDDNLPIIKDYKKDDPGSILKYIRISPRSVTLAPQQKRIIRIACNLPSSFENKEYKVMLRLTETNPEKHKLDSSTSKRSYGLTVSRESRAAAYIWKGRDPDLSSEVVIKDLKAEKFNISKESHEADEAAKKGEFVENPETDKYGVRFSFNYQNKGNVHSRKTIGARFFDSSGKLVFERSKVSVLVAFPTNEEKKIFYSNVFELPEEMDASADYSVQLVLTNRSNGKGNPENTYTKNEVLKTEKVDI